ncbi:TIGR01777 family oxidoreductase [Flavobacterium sp. JP2137]|uniref:TIGR01777 family oxidoreductase n=1 Tax=Flavobacterium sp. JP2137 TaxID=3414510 RepID=UPI003D2FFED9
MKILITGATGFIGSALTSYLLSKGYVVNYLTTDRAKIKDAIRYHGFYWNPAKSAFDSEALVGVEVIIHLAGSSISKRWTAKNKEEMTSSRVDSTRFLYQILEAQKHEVKQVVAASAIGIYRDSLTEIHREDSAAVDSGFLGDLVQLWEAENRRFEQLGIDVCLFRIGMVLSKNNGALPELIKPINRYYGAVLGSGVQIHSWIHREDLVYLFEFAISHQLKGVYNAVTPHPVTQRELVYDLKKILKKPLLLPRIPAVLLKLVLGEQHVLVTASQRVSADKILKEGYEFKFPEMGKALANLLK